MVNKVVVHAEESSLITEILGSNEPLLSLSVSLVSLKDFKHAECGVWKNSNMCQKISA